MYKKKVEEIFVPLRIWVDFVMPLSGVSMSQKRRLMQDKDFMEEIIMTELGIKVGQVLGEYQPIGLQKKMPLWLIYCFVNDLED